jgi:transposase
MVGDRNQNSLSILRPNRSGSCYTSSLSPIQRFALRLQSDYDSVKAGVTFSISNGPVEGHINRLKMLKRQMYGRPNLDLLSRRFLIKL